MKNLTKFLSIGLLAGAAAACSDEGAPFAPEAGQDLIASQDKAIAGSPSEMTIAGTVVAAADKGVFTQLLGAVLAADPSVLEALDGRGKLTVFAPNDGAFEALAATGALDGISQEQLTEILLYHVTRGEKPASEVLAKSQLRMLNGDFARIDGSMAKIDQANIVDTDLYATNGIIHEIDAVLLPPSMPQQGNKAEPSILDLVLASAGDDPAEFTILKAAVEAASPEIAATLSGNGQFTVFAPTDDAFLALLGVLGKSAEELLADTELLNAVLLYHVTRGRLLAADVITKSQIRMLDGNRVWVDGTILNDGIEIIGTDIEARNGVVHKIDGVLLPPM
jgi:uncharacterized surface protein with fasciclin (FAS1) repeats